MFTIYCLLDPNTLHIRYVGVTKNTKRRRKDHQRVYKNRLRKGNHYRNWIESLLKNGQTPIFAILGEYNDLVDARLAERTWIGAAQDAGFDLVNWMVGGESYTGTRKVNRPLKPKRKYPYTPRIPKAKEEVSHNLSVALKNAWATKPESWAAALADGRIGKYERTAIHRYRSPEFCALQSRVQTGVKRRPWTDEQRQLCSAQRREMYADRPAVIQTQEVRDKIAAAHMRRRPFNYSEESLLSLSPLENSVVRLRFGIFGEPLLVRRQIAEVLGISHNQVRWAERTALPKLEKAA